MDATVGLNQGDEYVAQRKMYVSRRPTSVPSLQYDSCPSHFHESGFFVDSEAVWAASSDRDAVAVRIHSNSNKKPASAFSDGDDARRWRENIVGRRDHAPYHNHLVELDDLAHEPRVRL